MDYSASRKHTLGRWRNMTVKYLLKYIVAYVYLILFFKIWLLLISNIVCHMQTYKQLSYMYSIIL